MPGLLRRRPSPAFLVALLALFVALGGPAYAAKLINGKNIRKGTVSSKQLKDRGVAVRDLSKSAITSARYTPNNSITASKIRKDAVSTSEIKAGAVNSLQVADNTLLAQDLATNSVGGDELLDAGVKNADLGTSAVTKGKLAGGSVGGSEVADGTLTGKDVGAFSGTAALKVTNLAGGTCTTITTNAQSPLSGAQDVRDDLILVGRAAGMPNTLTVAAQANQDASTAFDVVLCNLAPTTSVPLTADYVVPFLTVNP